MSTPPTFLPGPTESDTTHAAPVLVLRVSANYVVSGSADHFVRIWLKSSGNLVQPPVSSYPEAAIKSVEISEELGVVFGGDGKGNIVAWQLSTGERLFIEPAHSDTVLSLTIDKNTLVSSSRDQCAKIWELVVHDSGLPASLQLRHTLEGHSMAVLAVQVAGSRVYTTSGDKSIRVWDKQSGNLIRTLEGLVSIAQFQIRKGVTGTEQLLGASTDKTVRLYDLETGAELACLTGHTNVVCSAQFLELDRVDVGHLRIVSASYDGSIRVWKVLAEPPFSYTCVEKLSFSSAVVTRRAFPTQTRAYYDPVREQMKKEREAARQAQESIARVLDMQVSGSQVYCCGESAHIINWNLISPRDG